MTQVAPFLRGLLLLFSTAVAASATVLTWDHQTADVAAKSGQAAVAVEFPFYNASEIPVTIKAVSTSCSCTQATADRTTYAPGEHGVIRAAFSVGDITGQHEETIDVETNQSTPDAPDELLLRVRVPQDFLISPRVLAWAVGAKSEEKVITCAAMPGRSIVVSSARPADPTVKAWLETVQAGQKYHVHVTPGPLGRAVTIPVVLTISVDGQPARPVNAYAAVTQF